MQFDFGLSSGPPPGPPPGADLNTDLLRQLVETQREMVNLQKTMLAVLDHNARWRVLLQRWREDFPNISQAARAALPVLEKSYGSILNTLVEELSDQGQEGLDSDFALQEFLDRYGMRLSQLSHILNLVTPLAEMNLPNEST